MQEATSPKRKSFSLYAIVSTLVASATAVGAMLAGVTPASAASLATQPDTQIMVFMVPLTLLVLVLLFEVARFASRSATLPTAVPARTRPRRYWSAGEARD